MSMGICDSNITACGGCLESCVQSSKTSSYKSIVYSVGGFVLIPNDVGRTDNH